MIINYGDYKMSYSKDGSIISFPKNNGGNLGYGVMYACSWDFLTSKYESIDNKLCYLSNNLIKEKDEYDKCDKCNTYFLYDKIKDYLFDIKQECPHCKHNWNRLPCPIINSIEPEISLDDE